MTVAVLLYGSRKPVPINSIDELRDAELKYLLNRKSLKKAEPKLLSGSPLILCFGETANAALFQTEQEPEYVVMGDFNNETSKNDVLMATQANLLE